jgi:hypothetical protein
MKSVIALAALICLFSLLSCDAVSPEDVPGIYVMKLSYGVELLRLEANGRYTQVIMLSRDSTALSHSGQWRISGSQIDLENGLELYDLGGDFNPNYATPVNGLLGAGVLRREGGTVWLLNDENNADCKYRKIE